MIPIAKLYALRSRLLRDSRGEDLTNQILRELLDEMIEEASRPTKDNAHQSDLACMPGKSFQRFPNT